LIIQMITFGSFYAASWNGYFVCMRVRTHDVLMNKVLKMDKCP